MEKKNNLLLIIDPGNDFTHPDGKLYIPGAERAISELEKVISTEGDKFGHICLVQDSHYSYHIGHSVYWNEMPEPGTIITSEDVKSGKYTPLGDIPFQKDIVTKYLEKVESLGNQHRIWPEHCIIGSWGWAFPDSLVEAVNLWTLKTKNFGYTMIQKGVSSGSEMYSVFSSADGQTDEVLLDSMKGYDNIYIAGFAKDICVAETVKDFVSDEDFRDKLIFLDSCMTPLDPESPALEIYKEAIEYFGATTV